LNKAEKRLPYNLPIIPEFGCLRDQVKQPFLEIALGSERLSKKTTQEPQATSFHLSFILLFHFFASFYNFFANIFPP
jgi:hypothetical protein